MEMVMMEVRISKIKLIIMVMGMKMGKMEIMETVIKMIRIVI